MRRALLSLLVFSLLFAGCINLPTAGEEIDISMGNSDGSMTSEQIMNYLNNDEVMDLVTMSNNEEQFKVEIYSKGSQNNQTIELTYIIGKDEVAQLYETGLKLDSASMGLEYSVIQGDSKNINVRVGNQWYLARDEVPEFIDPFVDIEQATGSQSSGESQFDLSPDFDILDMELEDFDWVVTLDPVSMQQVATSSNDTHSLMLEFLENPARLHEIEILSFDGDEAMKVTIHWGEDAQLSVSDDHTRTSVFMDMDEEMLSDFHQELTTFNGVLNESHNQEVMMSDIELRIGSTNSETDEFEYFVSLPLTNLTTNYTDDSGYWWNIEWQDVNGDELVSSGDTYTVVSNHSSAWDFDVKFYDSWSESYEGGALPGFELLFLILALIFSAHFNRKFVN
tara:strand:+ start:854 stop:2035 length:1182 start_codon:yes stop_codon:yes gene_type:complete